MTPSIAIVRIETPHRRWPRLWIPALLLSPLILLVLFGLCMAGGVSPWRAIAGFWSILCSLPGTNVRVCADGNNMQVRIL